LEVFLLGQALEVAACLARLELIEQRDALLDGDEVGEHAAEPAAVDVRLAGAGRFLGDRLLGLLLGADEEHAVAAGDGLAGGVEGEVQPLDGLGKVDDVDPVALREDERLHLGIPATGLVAEMDPGLQELPHRNGRHELTSCGCFLRSAPVGNRSADRGSGTAPTRHSACDLRSVRPRRARCVGRRDATTGGECSTAAAGPRTAPGSRPGPPAESRAAHSPHRRATPPSDTLTAWGTGVLRWGLEGGVAGAVASLATAALIALGTVSCGNGASTSSAGRAAAAAPIESAEASSRVPAALALA
jgi:hypothetical protein